LKKYYLILLLFLFSSLFLFKQQIPYTNTISDTRYIIIKPDTDINCQWILFDTTHHDSIIDNNDNTKVRYNNPNKLEILGFDTNTLLSNEYISQLKLYSRGNCFDNSIYRPKFDYYWNNEYQNLNEIVELIVSQSILSNYYEWTSNIIIELNGSQSDLDNLIIKYIAPSNIPFLKYGQITEVYIEVEIILTENGNGNELISNWEGVIIFFLIIMSIIFIIFIFVILYYIQKQ